MSRHVLSDIGHRLLMQLEPEMAHGLALQALRHGLGPHAPPPARPALAVSIAGINFPSPVGLAAGFDKNARVTAALGRAGFGFVEAGSVTLHPQEGNPSPRLFRLPADRALINRLGFNNEGAAAAVARLEGQSGLPIVGINIGVNRTSTDKIGDYLTALAIVRGVADYVVVNVSSPNTPGLRDLQGAQALRALLGPVTDAARGGARPVPVFVKIAPDLDEAAIAAIAAVLLECGVDGLIAANTTVARPATLKDRHAGESGGLSGAPLFEHATIVLAKFSQALDGRVPIIGSGGVMSGADAFAKIAAGASLVQVYSGLIYRGLGLLDEILDAFSAELARRRLPRLADAVGIERSAWAARPLPAG